MKVFILSFMTMFLLTPLIWVAIPVMIYISYSVIHEFIHAAAIKRYGGLLDKVFLGYPRPYIEFQMPSVSAEKKVFGWGAVADLILMSLVSVSLFSGWAITGNNLLSFLGVMFIVVFVFGEFLPKHSDFDEYSKRSLQKV